MPERPLLILPSPGEPARRPKKTGGGGNLHLPSRDRQAERLTPKFTVLNQAFDAQRVRLQIEAAGLVPEEVVVLETVGPVDDFIVAVRGIRGLEWLGEIEEEDIPPDDDFFTTAKGAPQREKALRGRVFMIMSNQQALQQILSLWDAWKQNRALPYGFGKWADLFGKLHDVRLWGVYDRLEETGVLADWRERAAHDEEVIPCEIELWFRGSAQRRQAGRARVTALVSALQGQVLHEAVIEEIAYHGLLVRLPVGAVRQVLEQVGQETALIQCEQIQFFLATGQMAGIVGEEGREPDATAARAAPGPLGEPVVALFDGLPLQNHSRLADRLVVDDPDGAEPSYPAAERQHGTAMASLILHGDIKAAESPLPRRLYVRPILRPNPQAWRHPRWESAPDDGLLVDLVHRAVRRLYESDNAEPAVAPQVCVINLSIGIKDRPFQSALSPLARLLDWLAWKYRVLFLVSAGNHAHAVELGLAPAALAAMPQDALQAAVIQSVAADARHRRLLSPAEAINVLTIGATDQDASGTVAVPRAIQPFAERDLPSVINAQGMGYRRSIKPEVLCAGGRIVLLESIGGEQNGRYDVYTQALAPGQFVACPGATPGDLNACRFMRGTSNATALASRAAAQLYDVLQELGAGDGAAVIDDVPRALWIKTLLVHAASWGRAGSVLEQVLKTPANSRKFKEYITRLLGYGVTDWTRVKECTPFRVTALGCGQLQADQTHIHRLPLPPSLSGRQGKRRVTITLGWFTSVNPAHQSWRRAALWFSPRADALNVGRIEADWRAVQRGTVQHEVLEGDKASAYVDGDAIEVQVSCRPDAGALEEAVPYSLAISLDVAEEIGVDIYNEVRTRVHAARITIAATG